MTKKKVIKILRIFIVTLMLIIIFTGIFDWIRVRKLEKPVFTVPITWDDGGSGTYYGLGYMIDLQGNFMPEDELPGVTHYKYYILGMLVDEQMRD